jgi:hypothetical protein
MLPRSIESSATTTAWPQTGFAAPLPRTQHGSRLNPPPKDFHDEDDLGRTCPVQVHDTINTSQSAAWPKAGLDVSLWCRQHVPRLDLSQKHLALDRMQVTQNSFLRWLVAVDCCRQPLNRVRPHRFNDYTPSSPCLLHCMTRRVRRLCLC